MSDPDKGDRRDNLRLLEKAHRDNDQKAAKVAITRLVPDPDDVRAWRSVAVKLMNYSLLSPAIKAQLNCVNAGVRLNRRLADNENLLVAMILM